LRDHGNNVVGELSSPQAPMITYKKMLLMAGITKLSSVLNGKLPLGGVGTDNYEKKHDSSRNKKEKKIL